jgi:uncharacterized protein YdhG (YjbR/CyaY superfamily)
MVKTPSSPANIDEYIAAAPPAARPILREIRRVIHAAAPGAEELISYRMPAFKQHGILVYFAAFKRHIGLYPPVSGDTRLKRTLKTYAGPKGNLKFPLNRAIPYALIRRIVKLKVKQNLARASAKSTKEPPSGKRKTRTPRGRLRPRVRSACHYLPGN